MLSVMQSLARRWQPDRTTEHTVDISTADSLLDEADFLEELGNLEDGMTVKRREYEPIPDLTTPVRATPLGKFPEPAPVAAVPDVDDERAGPTMAGQIAAAAMFVLMMGAGAAGAAMVFHERVVRILAAW